MRDELKEESLLSAQIADSVLHQIKAVRDEYYQQHLNEYEILPELGKVLKILEEVSALLDTEFPEHEIKKMLLKLSAISMLGTEFIETQERL